MATITVRVDDELKRKMDELKDVNWSEVIREKIREVIEEEERRRSRKKDFSRIARASLKAEELSSIFGGKNSEETIREWRDRNWL